MTTAEYERRLSDNTTVAQGLFDAYRRQDRSTAERLLADDLVFTSPQDDHIDRAAYLERCFPTADRFESQHLLYLTDLDEQHVLIAYEYELRAGGRYRNTEIITVRNGQATEIQVFFGGRSTAAQF